MHPFTLLIKPASSGCNLRCHYCFYLDRGHADGRMSADVLEALTAKYLALPLTEYLFAWQGGEPTLMGLDFFRLAIARQKRPGKRIRNVLQTNGTRIDHEWGEWLRRHDFLVGISLDGPPEIHDRYRLTAAGAGSSGQVLRGLRHLQECGVEHNVLTLVSAANVEHPVQVYEYLLDQGLHFHQYIECIETEPDGTPRPCSLRPGQFGEFLCRLFDRWYPHDCQRVSIRLFDSILARLVSRVPTVCPMGCDCRHYLVIEHDGGAYPCDFFVSPDECLGNITQTSFKTLLQNSRYHAFGRRKQFPASPCGECRFWPLCMGDCPKNRRSGLSLLCQDWQLFYAHCIGRFEQLAARCSTGSFTETRQ